MLVAFSPHIIKMWYLRSDTSIFVSKSHLNRYFSLSFYMLSLFKFQFLSIVEHKIYYLCTRFTCYNIFSQIKTGFGNADFFERFEISHAHLYFLLSNSLLDFISLSISFMVQINSCLIFCCKDGSQYILLWLLCPKKEK